MKKFLAILLTVVMVLGAVSVTALFSSADVEDYGVYSQVIVTKEDGTNYAAVVGTINTEDFDAVSLHIDLTFKQDGSTVKTVSQDIENVYKTVTGVASTTESTAAAQSIAFIDGAAYIYAIRMRNIPVGNYTVEATVTTTNAQNETATTTSDAIPFLVPTEEQQLVLDAYALDRNEVLEDVTMTGVVTSVVEISAIYGNATFYFVVGGLTDKPIEAYRVKGADGVDINDIEVDATVTVSGNVTNYNGTIEFTNTSLIIEIVEPERTDAEKVQIEHDNLTITPSAGAEVPSAGTRYPEVAITWSSSNATVVSVVDGVITVDNSTLTEATDVVLTATLSLNEASLTKDFTIGVSAPTGEETEPKTWTLTFPSGNSAGNTSYTGSFSATLDGQTWDLYGFNNGGAGTNAWTVIRTGRRDYALVSTITTTISGTVENVVLHLTQVNASKTNSIKLYVLNGTAQLAVIDIDSVSTGNHTFTIPAAVQAAGLTYKLEFDLQADGSANGSTRLDQVTYNGFVTTGGTQPTVTDEEKVAAEVAALDIVPANGVALPSAGATYTDVVIEWESDNEMVSVDNGVITVNNTLEEGDDDVTVTIIATFTLGDVEDTKNFTMTLSAPVQPSGETVTDTLNRALTGASGTNYTDWSGKQSESDAVYSGNSAGGNSSIQIRSNNSNSGIVTTASGGTVASITITFNSNTTNGRTVNVYGKNTAYSAASDLYGNNAGTLLGTIVYGTSTTITVEDDYEFIGLRSASGAIYIDSIEIVWNT